MLGDIRRHAAFSASDKEEYAAHLMRIAEQEWDGELSSWKKEAERCANRLAELDVIIRTLYEDSVFGRIPRERYASLSETYETEAKKLKERKLELQNRMDAYCKRSRNVEEFAPLVAQYADIPCLTEELLNTLVEKIFVHEKEVIDGNTFMRVEIYYRFIGSVGNGDDGDLKAKKYVKAR